MNMDSSHTQDDSTETQQKTRRWPQFSLRTLLLLLLLVRLPLSWIATRRLRAVREDTAIKNIREMGGVLSFYGREDLLGWKSSLWLLKLTGSGPRTATIWFPEPSTFTDNDVELLLRLDPLPAVSLHNTRITDRGLESLARHPGIQRLDLKGTTDQGTFCAGRVTTGTECSSGLPFPTAACHDVSRRRAQGPKSQRTISPRSDCVRCASPVRLGGESEESMGVGRRRGTPAPPPRRFADLDAVNTTGWTGKTTGRGWGRGSVPHQRENRQLHEGSPRQPHLGSQAPHRW